MVTLGRRPAGKVVGRAAASGVGARAVTGVGVDFHVVEERAAVAVTLLQVLHRSTQTKSRINAPSSPVTSSGLTHPGKSLRLSIVFHEVPFFFFFHNHLLVLFTSRSLVYIGILVLLD